MKIVICGSMQYAEKMMEAQNELQSLGHEAFIPGATDKYIGKTDRDKEILKLEHKMQNDAIIEHWELIKHGDAILVLNFDKHGIPNYIGGNSFLEIGFAYVLGKKIFLLHPIPDIPYYKTEIEAVRPVILNGDFKKLTKEGS